MGKNYSKRREIRRQENKQQNEKRKIRQQEKKEDEKRKIQYQKKVDEIKNLIDKTFPNIKPQYNFNDKHKYYEAFFQHSNGICILSIQEDSKWIDIKKKY